ncbi:MAG: transposase, partial [Planctomycetes bacterium]|nr:transposase [Planctomycetota bacterium]
MSRRRPRARCWYCPIQLAPGPTRDPLITEVPVRQWMLSLPYRVRHLCAYDADACARVRRILVRAVSGYYERRARRLGKPRPRAGAVAFVQRFDSALRLNVHFHVLWTDGVFAYAPGRVEFCEHGELSDADVGRLVRAIRDRVQRALRGLGKLPAAGDGLGFGNGWCRRWRRRGKGAMG